MLRQSLKFIFRDTALYGGANAVSKLFSFLTIPIIVRHIAVAEFGIWTMLTILGTIISAVVIFGMDSAVARYHADCKSDKEKHVVFSHGFFFQLFLVAVFLIIGFLVPGLFLKFVYVNESYIDSVLLIFIWIPANIYIHYFQNWFKWTFQRTRFLIIALGSGSANFFFLLFYSYISPVDLKTILAIQAGTAWLFMLLGLWMCRKYFSLSFNKTLFNNLLRYGWPMMLVFVISVLMPSLDRMFLSRHLSEEQLGVYSLCQKIGAIMSLAVLGFQMAFGPLSMSIWEKPDARRTFARFQSYYLIVGGMIALSICSFGKPLILMFGTKEYLGAEKYLPLLVTGAFIYGLYSFASIGIFYSKKVQINLIVLAIGIVVNIGFNFFFTPHFLQYGAAGAFLLGNAAMIVSGYFFSLKYYSLDFSFVKDFLKLIVTSLGMFVLSVYSFHTNIWMDAVIKLFTLVPMYVILTFFFLTKNEKAYLREKLSSF